LGFIGFGLLGFVAGMNIVRRVSPKLFQ